MVSMTATVLILATTLVGQFNVRDAGAKGDGMTDDGPAIAASLKLHSWVIIPDGTFLTSQRHDLRDNQHLTISGTLMPHKDMGPIQSMLVTVGVSGVLIDGSGILDGGGLKNPELMRFGIKIDSGSRNITIRGLEIRYMPSAGNGIRYGDGIYVGKQSTSFDTVPWNVTIEGVNCHHNGRVGIGVTAGQMVKVLNSTCSDHDFGGGIDLEPNVSTLPFEDVQVRNCISRDNGACGISAGAMKIEKITLTRISIIGNNLANNGVKMKTSAAGISMAKDFIFSDNIIYHTVKDRYGFLVSDCRRGVVNGNEVQGGGYGIMVASKTEGATRNILLTSNAVWGQTDCGISADPYSQTASGIVFAGNNISNDLGSAGPRYCGMILMSGYTASCNTFIMEGGLAGIDIRDRRGIGASAVGNIFRGPMRNQITIPANTNIHTIANNVGAK